MIREERLIFNVAGLIGSLVPDVDGGDDEHGQWFCRHYKTMRVKWMRTCLEQALDDMREVLMKAKQKGPVKVKPTVTPVPESTKPAPVSIAAEPVIKEHINIPLSPTETMSLASRSQLGFSLAYPARTLPENIFLPEDLRSGVVGEDVGFVEFDWGEKKSKRNRITNVVAPWISAAFSSPARAQSETSISSEVTTSSSYSKSKKLLRMIREWAPTLTFTPSSAAAPTTTTTAEHTSSSTSSPSPVKVKQVRKQDQDQ